MLNVIVCPPKSVEYRGCSSVTRREKEQRWRQSGSSSSSSARFTSRGTWSSRPEMRLSQPCIRTCPEALFAACLVKGSYRTIAVRGRSQRAAARGANVTSPCPPRLRRRGTLRVVGGASDWFSCLLVSFGFEFWSGDYREYACKMGRVNTAST